jgi:two-component system chemotaxis response regulator CheB
MPKRDIVVVGASAGGVQVLQEMVQGLPRDYPGTIFVVLHTGPGSLLPEILSRANTVPAVQAEHHVRYERNRIYVAPPNRHLLINDGVMVLDPGPRENGSRPSVDPLFRSAARTHRSRVVGVIVSGTLDDGSAGLFAVKARGGIAIVQDPAEATSPEMPMNAMQNVKVDYCISAAKLGALLTELAATEAPASDLGQRGMNEETRELVDPPDLIRDPPPNDRQIALSCPECGGALYEEKSGAMAHFMCHVGHSFSPESLSEIHKEALERALWQAMRTLNERITLHQQFIRRQRNAGEETLLKRFEDSLASAERDVELLRDIIARI